MPSRGTGSLSRIGKSTGGLPTVSEVVDGAIARAPYGRGGFRPVLHGITRSQAAEMDVTILKERGLSPSRLAVIKECSYVLKAQLSAANVEIFFNKYKSSVYADLAADLISVSVDGNGDEVFEIMVRGDNTALMMQLMSGLVTVFSATPAMKENSFLTLGVGLDSQAYPVIEDSDFSAFDLTSLQPASAGNEQLDVMSVVSTTIVNTNRKRPTLVVAIADLFPEELTENELQGHLDRLNNVAGLAAVLSSKKTRAKLANGYLYLSAAAERFASDLLQIARNLHSVLPSAAIKICEVEMREIGGRFAVKTLENNYLLSGKIMLSPEMNARFNGSAVDSRDGQHVQDYDSEVVQGGFILKNFKIRPNLANYPITGEKQNALLNHLESSLRFSETEYFKLCGPAGIGKSTVVANVCTDLSGMDFMIASYRDFNAGVPGASLRDIYGEICDFVEENLMFDVDNKLVEARRLVAEYRRMTTEEQRVQFQKYASVYVANIAEILGELNKFAESRDRNIVFVLEDLHFSDEFSKTNIMLALAKFKLSLKGKKLTRSRLKFLFTSREQFDFSTVQSGYREQEKEWVGNLETIEFARLGEASVGEDGFVHDGKPYIINRREVEGFVNNYFARKVDKSLGLEDYTAIDVAAFGQLFFAQGGNPAYTNDIIQDALAKNAVYISDSGLLTLTNEYLNGVKDSILPMRTGMLREVYENRFESIDSNKRKVLLIINILGRITVNDLLYLSQELNLENSNDIENLYTTYILPLIALGLISIDSKDRITVARPDYADAINAFFSKRDIGRMAASILDNCGHVLDSETVNILSIRAFNGLDKSDFGPGSDAVASLDDLSNKIEDLYVRGQFSLLARYLFENPLISDLLDQIQSGGSPEVGIDVDKEIADFAVKCLAYGVMSYVVTSDFAKANQLIQKYGAMMTRVDEYAKKFIIGTDGAILEHPVNKYASKYFMGEFMYYYLVSADKKGEERAGLMAKMEDGMRCAGEVYGNNLLFVYYLYRVNAPAKQIPADILEMINLRLAKANLPSLNEDDNTRDFVDNVFDTKTALTRFYDEEKSRYAFDIALVNEGVRLISRASMQRLQATIDDKSQMDDRVNYLYFSPDVSLARLKAKGRSLVLDSILKEALDSPANITGVTLVDFFSIRIELDAIAMANLTEVVEKYPELVERCFKEMYETARSVGNDKQAVIACNMAARYQWMAYVAACMLKDGNFRLTSSDFKKLIQIKAIETKAADKLPNDAIDKRIAYQDLVYFVANYGADCDFSEMDDDAQKMYLSSIVIISKALNMIIVDSSDSMKLTTAAAYMDWSLLILIYESLVNFQAAHKQKMRGLLLSMGLDPNFIHQFKMQVDMVKITMRSNPQQITSAQAKLSKNYRFDLDGSVALRRKALEKLAS